MGGIGINGREKRETKSTEKKGRYLYSIPHHHCHWSGDTLLLPTVQEDPYLNR
jgi:hypothetical protein